MLISSAWSQCSGCAGVVVLVVNDVAHPSRGSPNKTVRPVSRPNLFQNLPRRSMIGWRDWPDWLTLIIHELVNGEPTADD